MHSVSCNGQRQKSDIDADRPAIVNTDRSPWALSILAETSGQRRRHPISVFDHNTHTLLISFVQNTNCHSAQFSYPR
jgi:hypothetical protein